MAGETVTAYEQVTRTRLEALEEKFEKHEQEQAAVIKEIRDDIKAIRKDLERRLPLWVTVLLGLVGVGFGFLLGLLQMAG